MLNLIHSIAVILSEGNEWTNRKKEEKKTHKKRQREIAM